MSYLMRWSIKVQPYRVSDRERFVQELVGPIVPACGRGKPSGGNLTYESIISRNSLWLRI